MLWKKKLHTVFDYLATAGGSTLDKKDSEDTFINGPAAFTQVGPDEELVEELLAENRRLKEALRKHWTTGQYIKSEQIRRCETDEWFARTLEEWTHINADVS